MTAPYFNDRKRSFFTTVAFSRGADRTLSHVAQSAASADDVLASPEAAGALADAEDLRRAGARVQQSQRRKSFPWAPHFPS